MVVRLLQCAILEYKFLTSDVLFVSCSRPNGFEFKAGQFVSIKMYNAQGFDPFFRWKSYSICSYPSQKGTLDFVIKIIPRGFASEAFLKLKVGDIMEIRGPLGHFVFREESMVCEHWFLGAGTGITPLYSMVCEYASRMPFHRFVIVFGVRHKENLFYMDEIARLVSKCPNVTFIPTLSRDNDNWEGACGRVQVHLPSDLTGKDFYICGLNELIVETKEFLLAGGVAKEYIYFERYD